MSSPSSTLTRPHSLETTSQQSSRPSQAKASKYLDPNVMKSIYSADQQVKFLHLQAEVETLLLQLQALKQQRQTAVISTPLATVSASKAESN